MLARHTTHCPIAFALNVIGDRWSLLILRDILFQGKKYYTDFLSGQECISTNILADRLLHLEQEGIVEKLRDDQNRKRFIYQPTPKGLDLVPVILAIVRWSGKHDAQTEAPREFLRKLEKPANQIEVGVRKQFAASARRSNSSGNRTE